MESTQPLQNPKPTTNALVIDTVIMLCTRYRQHHNMLDNEVLSEQQIEEMLKDLKGLIYKREGIYKKKV